MQRLTLRRRPSVCGLASSSSYSSLCVVASICVGTVLVLWLSEQDGGSVSQQRPHARRLRAAADFSRSRNVIRHRGRQFEHAPWGGERFATLYHSELTQHFDFTKSANIAPDLIATLKNIENVGITMVMFSCPWEWFQPENGTITYDSLDALASTTCQNTELKVAFLIDLVRAPEWVFEKWPEAKAVDSHWKSYNLLSWFHPEANQLALDTLMDVVAHLTATHPDCVTAVQPVYNNQYEARYTQENDCFQDYSPPAIAAFRKFLGSHEKRLEAVNGRYGTNYSSWEAVMPPRLEAGSFMGPDVTPRYWDFITFRELYGAQVLNRACAAVQAAGTRCFHHVPELFTVLDAVYGSTMFKHIAASPHTDFLIMTTSFRTSYGAAMSPTTMRLGVAAATSYNKPVFFEASLEHKPSIETLEAAMSLALAAGAVGAGVSNWVRRFDFTAELGAALQPLQQPCRTEEVVVVFVPLDSFSAFHGLQWSYQGKDPIYTLVESIAEPLSVDCGTTVSVVLELSRLPAALRSLNRVVFLEPVVLLGDAQLELYMRVKEAVRALPHEFVQLPFSQTRGIRTAVMPDLL